MEEAKDADFMPAQELGRDDDGVSEDEDEEGFREEEDEVDSEADFPRAKSKTASRSSVSL